MNNLKKRFTATVTGIMAVFLFPLEMALATPDNEMGCISRQQGTMKFVRSDQLDRETIIAAAKTQRLQGAKTADPCLTGQVKHLPASVYAKLAEMYPDKFQPLDTLSSNTVASSRKSSGGAAKPKTPQYHLNSIPIATADILLFDPVSLKNDDKVYGTAYTEFFEAAPFFTTFAAVFKDEAVTMLKNSKGFIVSRANARGTLGGFILTDFENFFTQAALFYDHEIHLIPRLPGEISSEVILLNDRGAAIISSLDENFNSKLMLYKNGHMTPLDFGPDIPQPSRVSMNNKGIISGTTFIDGVGYRGFRHDPRKNQTIMLEPLPTEPDAWAMGINNHGYVLGYSFVGGGIERIGVWDEKGKFHTYFVEGTPEIPTVSNVLLFNDRNEILITFITRPLDEFRNSYLVPKPGVRLNLADLVTGEPADLGIFPQAINNHGNILGYAGPNFFSRNEFFLLERTDHGRH